MAEINDEEMFSMSYKDARDKYAVGVGNNKYFMSESDFNKGKERINKKNAEKQAANNNPNKKEEPKKDESLVAQKFGAKKEKTWNDVKSEYNNDPAKIADYLNNATDYTAGNLTKKGMEGFGYSQGADGKWAPKPKTETPTTETPTTETETTGTTAETETTGTTAETETTGTTTKTETTTDDAINGVEGITKEDSKAKRFVDDVTNEDGSVNEQKALNAMSQYEQKMVEMGAGSFDKDGKFVFKDTTKKGWEDWATMLSVGASVIGLAMGVPIMPINFRKITNKDEKDAKIREFQKKYVDIMAGNAAKVKDAESSAEAGKFIKENQDNIDAYSKYKNDNAAQKDIIGAQTDAEKELIETRTDAQIKADEEQFERDMKRLKSDKDFQLKYAALQQQYAKEMEELKSDLSTSSAIDLMKYQNSGFLKDLQDMGMSLSDIASYTAAKNGISPADKNWNRVKMVSDMANNTANTILDHIPFLGKGKGKKE